MRFLYLPLTIAALAIASVQRQPDARPVVILVHGRGHLDDDSASLRKNWKQELDSALGSVGMPRLAHDDLRLAWYADVLDPATPAGCRTTPSPDDSLGFGTFASDFLNSLVSALPRTESREVRGFLGDLLYAADPSRRCAAERRVGESIEQAIAEKRPVIVVAYSLGSLVTYGYLNSRARERGDISDVRLITIGSPLGNREMRALLGQDADSLRIPAIVGGWENVYDPGDAFAAPVGMESLGVRDRVVAGGARDDPHHIGSYLRDHATGAAIGRALCAAAPRAFGSSCRALPR